MQIGTVDLNKLRFVVDKTAGLVKELVGVLVGSDRLQKEGESQQERATEEARAFRNEIEAQKQDAKAASYEKRQKAAARSSH